MHRLVKTYFASSRKPKVGDRSPPCILHLRTGNAFLSEFRYLGLQVVTHEVKFVATTLFGGMNRRFRWRQREDQPSAAGVNAGKAEDVPEERAIGRRILAIYDYMGAKDHPLLPSPRTNCKLVTINIQPYV